MDVLRRWRPPDRPALRHRAHDRLREAKVAYRGVGENVGYAYRTPKEAVAGWMNSAPHKANLLNKDFTEIGVAVAKSADGTPYWTQIFAVPLR